MGLDQEKQGRPCGGIDTILRAEGIGGVGGVLFPRGLSTGSPQIINEIQIQKKAHEKFSEKFGGKVFYVISVADGKQKVIQNKEVIEEIRKEISRLRKP